MIRQKNIIYSLDWMIIFIYLILVLIGVFAINSVVYTTGEQFSFFDLKNAASKQMTFFLLSIPLILLIMLLKTRYVERITFVLYLIGILSLIGLFFFGKTIKGQTNWYKIGEFGLQPSEFVKTTTALLVAKFFTFSKVNMATIKSQLISLSILLIPVTLVVLQPDVGSAMIFVVLVLVLYREGLPGYYLVYLLTVIVSFILSLILSPIYPSVIILTIGLIHFFKNKKITRNPFVYSAIILVLIGFCFSTKYIYDNILEKHHKDRINILIGKNVNEKKEGYNTNQSIIAIGSGGWIGKGYLEGTQTRGNFVPEQRTDYIFTTIAEEWGFLGSFVIILLFAVLILRILHRSEKHKSEFTRVYGYCVAAYLFIHFSVNIAMTIKLFPTIGVPLPFISYGGSSLWAFTLMLFLFLKMDADQSNQW